MDDDSMLAANMARRKLTPEQFEKKEAIREAENARQDKLREEFRGWFATFAEPETATQTRVDLLGSMKDAVAKEKQLPSGITREDIVKGIRNVKFNIGCTRDKPKKDPDCKAIEKSYMKLLAVIDKTYDRNIITR